MSHFYSIRSVTEDRDLSRAAAERSLMLQALSDPQTAELTSPAHRILTRLRHLRRPRRAAPRPVGAAKPAAASMAK